MHEQIEFASMRFTINGPHNWSDGKTTRAIQVVQEILDSHAAEITAELKIVSNELELKYGR